MWVDPRQLGKKNCCSFLHSTSKVALPSESPSPSCCVMDVAVPVTGLCFHHHMNPQLDCALIRHEHALPLKRAVWSSCVPRGVFFPLFLAKALVFAQLQDGLFKVRIQPDHLPDVHGSPWTRERTSSSDRGIDFCQTLHVILVS